MRIAEISIDIGRQLHGNTICFELPLEGVKACRIGDLPPEKALCIRTLFVNDDWLIGPRLVPVVETCLDVRLIASMYP